MCEGLSLFGGQKRLSIWEVLHALAGGIPRLLCRSQWCLPKNKSSEVRLLPPRRVPLTTEQRRQEVDLLAELLLDVAAKRRAARLGGAFDGVIDGVSGSVVRLPQKRRKGREAA